MKAPHILLGLALVAGAASAQDRPRQNPGPTSSAVEGRITDSYGRPLESADVVLLDPGTGLVAYGTATAADGTFRMAPIRPGTYRMVVSYVGFAGWSGDVQLLPGNPFRLGLGLSPEAVEQSEIVITARRARPGLTPVTASSVRRVDLERRPSMKDLPAQLASLPSATWYSENGNGMGYSYLRMRGFGQRRIAVSVNGIPQNDPEEFNVFWINFFDLQGVIDDIQVQRGAGSSHYGPAAIGGTIDIRALPYRPYPFARLHAGYGAFDTRRMSIETNTGLLGGRWVTFARVSRLQSDGYRDWSWSDFWRFFAGVTRYGDRSTLTVQAYGGPQEDGLAYSGIPKEANDGPVEDAFGTVMDRRFNWSGFTRDREWFHQPHVEAFHTLDMSERASLSQALFWIGGNGYFDFDGTFRSADYLRLPDGLVPADQRALPLYESRPEDTVLFRAVLDQWQAGWLPRLTVTSSRSETRIGLEARLHRSLRWGRIQEATGIPEDLVGGDRDVRVYSFRGEKTILAASVSHLVRVSSTWAVQGDVQATWRRYRVHDEQFFGTEFSKPYLFVNPRIGVTWRPEQPLSAYLSVALSSREPRMKSLYDGEEAGAGFTPRFARRSDGSLDTGRPDVGSERVVDVELGAVLRAPRWRLTVNGFWMEFADEIVPSGGLDQYGVPRTGNAERTRHTGIEIDGAVRLARGLDLKANAAWSRNRFVRFTEFITLPDWSVAPVDRAGNPIAGFPGLVANAAIEYSRESLSARLAVAAVGRQYIDNGGGEDPDGLLTNLLWVDAHALVEAGVRYRFADRSRLSGLELQLDVSNMLDARVLQYGNVGFGTPQFFPAATRHAFVGVRYTVR